MGRPPHRAGRRGGEGGRGLAGGGGPERGRPAGGRRRARPGHLHRGHPPADPGPVPVRQPRPPQDQGRGPARRTLPGGEDRGGREPDRGGGTGRALAADRPRPRDQPAQGPLGAGPGGHGPGRPAGRRAGPGQVAPGAHAEGARPGADGRRGGGRARHRVALLAALPEHGAVPGHRLLRAGPRLPPRGAAAGPVRPAAPPPGAVRPGPAGGRAAVGVAAVPADPGPLSAALVVAGPAAGGDVPAHAGVAARARRPQAGPVRRRGPALGGRVHPGVPGAVPRRGPARPHPDPAHLPPRVPDAVARRRPPDQPGPEPPDPAPGRRPDAEEDGGRPAGGGGRAGLRPDRRRAAVRRGIHEDGAGVGRARPDGARRRAARPCSGTRSPARSRTW